MNKVLWIALALVICGCHEDDHDHDTHSHEANTYNSHGCDHLEYGPFVELTLGATRAEAVSLAYMTHGKMTLAAGAEGFIKVETAVGAGKYALFSNNETLTLEDETGAVVTPDYNADSVPDCTLVKHKALYDLEAAKSYVVHVGPYTAEVKDQGVIVVHPDAERKDE